MFNRTRQALEAFDNSHDFERMCADILNALGYSGVEPMAPGGGTDSGRDIRYMERDAQGIAFVTLEKRIRAKVSTDLEKVRAGDVTNLSLFCNVNVSPALKLELTRMAFDRGATLTVYDVERLRSLLDTSLKDIRRRFLHIDDDASETIRAKVATTLRFPDAVAIDPIGMSLLEEMFVDLTPAKLFTILRDLDPAFLCSIPDIGMALCNVQSSYYGFKQLAKDTMELMMERVGANVGVRFPEAWRIYVRYAFVRFGGVAREEIERGGDFLNYGITWDSAERVAGILKEDAVVTERVRVLFESHQTLVHRTRELRAALGL